MREFLYIALAVLALGMLESFMGAPEVYGAEIQLQTAGSIYADPTPYYKGAN